MNELDERAAKEAWSQIEGSVATAMLNGSQADPKPHHEAAMEGIRLSVNILVSTARQEGASAERERLMVVVEKALASDATCESKPCDGYCGACEYNIRNKTKREHVLAALRHSGEKP